MSEGYTVRFTPEQAEAIVKVSAALCDDLGAGLEAFSAAGVAVDEAMANQDRTWESCQPCGGSGWIEG